MNSILDMKCETFLAYKQGLEKPSRAHIKAIPSHTIAAPPHMAEGPTVAEKSAVLKVKIGHFHCLPEASHHLLLEASFRSDFLNPREDSGLLVPELTSDGL